VIDASTRLDVIGQALTTEITEEKRKAEEKADSSLRFGMTKGKKRVEEMG